MEQVIILNEKYSNYWKWVLFLSLLVASALFLLYHVLDNVVWKNSLRLISFISFAIATFSGLKLIEGKREIEVIVNEGKITVNLVKNNSVLQSKQYELDQINQISKIPSEISLPLSEKAIKDKNGFTFQISEKKDEKPFYIFHFGGKILYVDNDSATRLAVFLQKKGIEVNNK